jgi:hypothetical protein
MAIEHERQLPDRRFEGGKTFLRRAVEHHADNDERSAVDLGRRDIGTHEADEALVEQPLSPPMAGGGTYIGGLGQIGIRGAAIALQTPENTQVDAVKLRRSGKRFFHLSVILSKKYCIHPRKIRDLGKIQNRIREHLSGGFG